MCGGCTAEVDAAEFISLTARPAAMIPWTNDEKVLLRGVVPLEQLVDLDWTIEVFLVPPTCDVQGWHCDTIQPRRKCLAFPERCVIGFVDEVGPGGNLALKILFIRVREWAEFQVPLVGVELINDLGYVGNLFA